MPAVYNVYFVECGLLKKRHFFKTEINWNCAMKLFHTRLLHENIVFANLSSTRALDQELIKSANRYFQRQNHVWRNVLWNFGLFLLKVSFYLQFYCTILTTTLAIILKLSNYHIVCKESRKHWVNRILIFNLISQESSVIFIMFKLMYFTILPICFVICIVVINGLYYILN